MLQHLFLILFRPIRTVERLVAERRFVRSWLATLFLIVLFAALSFVTAAYMSRAYADMYEWLPQFDLLEETTVRLLWLQMFWTVIFTGALLVFSRYGYAWIMQLGLLLSASRQLPADPEARREKARLLRLTHPYTLWIVVLPMLVAGALLPLFLDVNELLEMAIMSALEGGDSLSFEITEGMAGMLVWSLTAPFFLLLMYGYMALVRTIAIMKIYEISAARAFFGPFAAYVMVMFTLFLLGLLVAALFWMLGDAYIDPWMRV